MGSSNFIYLSEYIFVGNVSEPILSSGESSEDGSGNEEGNLREILRIWSTEENISHHSINRLLNYLKPFHHELPTDARTLLQTPRARASKIQPLGSGKYLYYGLEPITSQLTTGIPIELEINIDGLPLFRSSKMQLWPILGCVNNSKPFVIAVFCGDCKPPIHQFLHPFVEEVLRDSRITLSKIVCDSPARAMIKCIKSHTGYSSCDKCDVRGEYDFDSRQIVFIGSGNLRNDSDFRSQTDPNHHKGVSPLVDLPIDMVQSIPYDPMHLLFLGTMKKLLTFWDSGPRRTKLSASMISSVSKMLISFVAYFPSEFVRKPRSLEYLKYFKATEFRSFLLYTGCVVLKAVCSTEIYIHFLLLHCAAFILNDEQMYRSLNDKSDSFLKHFVEDCVRIYGRPFLSYNVHALLHLSKDCLMHGPLDRFSYFACRSEFTFPTGI